MTPDPPPQTSVELRWFLKGDAAKAALEAWIAADWLGTRARSPKQEKRTDSYLLVQGPDVGAKKRSQQQLEVKVRREVSPTRTFGRHAGCVERWTKWAVDNVAAGTLSADVRSRVEQATVRVDVVKTRLLRRLAIGAGAPHELPPDQWVKRAVGVELTHISAHQQHWWSVGFEAFPDEDTVREAFAPAVTRVLEPLHAIALAAPDSMGYPEWLTRRLATAR